MSAPTSYGTKYELFNVDFQRGDVFHFFNESQRTKYFNGKRISSGTINSYIRVDESFRVGDTYGDIMACNYCRYNNNDGAGWRYAYVTKMEVVSTTVTELFIQQDPWQNNMFSFEFHGTQLRGHVDRLKKQNGRYVRIYSRTPEPISASPRATSTTNNKPSRIQWVWFVFSQSPTGAISPGNSLLTDDYYYAIFPLSVEYTNFTISFTDGSQSREIKARDIEALNSNPYLVNKFYTTEPPAGISAQKISGGFSITKRAGVAYTAFSASEEGGYILLYSIYTDSERVQSILSSKGIEYVGVLPPNTVISKGMHVNKDFESKIFTEPYCYNEIRFGNTCERIANEALPVFDGSVPVVKYAVLPSGTSASCYFEKPSGYAKNTELITAGNAPVSQQGAVRQDLANTYIAANENRMGVSLLNGVINGLFQSVERGGFAPAILGAGSSMLSYYATLADYKNAPDNISLVDSPAAVVFSARQNVSTIFYKPKDDDLDRLWSFFNTFGYTVAKWALYNQSTIRTRLVFNYFQYGEDCHAEVEDSTTARELMQEDLRAGVTFWHYDEDLGGVAIRQTLENLEMSLLQ